MDFMILQEKIHIMHCKNKTRRTTATITTTTTKISQQQHPPHLNNLGFFYLQCKWKRYTIRKFRKYMFFFKLSKDFDIVP